MNWFQSTAISPIDGRYFDKTNFLRKIFSEFGLLKFRIKIEIEWFKKLSTISEISEFPLLDQKTINYLNEIEKKFNKIDFIKIKSLENKIHHDVKSLEYFLKNKIKSLPNLYSKSEFVHFACTSEDINNLSYGLMLQECRKKILIPYWNKVILKIKNLSILYRDVPMLSRTHGQAATPSTLGKEMLNFYYRMQRQIIQLKKIDILGKFNGTTGNYNAHYIAYPHLDWQKISQDFVLSLGLIWNPCTTQIEPHDYISELFSCIMRFNLILLNFNKDIWGYISINYFYQKNMHADIVGSSVMPHKINPIDFENSEGNLGLSNSLLSHMAHKLPISRWQRDLSDSTVLRNMGLAISYSILAYDSILLGIKKIQVNKQEILLDLDKHWEILSEPIQTIMRKHKIFNSYEKLKFLTQGKVINKIILHKFIEELEIPDIEKIKLKSLTPSNYLGLATKIVNDFTQ